MKALQKISFLLMLLLVNIGYAQQTLKLTIKSKVKNSESEFLGNVTFNVDENKVVNGEIEWSIVKIDRSQSIYYRDKMNATAIEYVKGTYNAAIGVLNFSGISKNDPKSIIGLDDYRLILIGGTVMGTSKGNGNWEGVISGSYIEEKAKKENTNTKSIKPQEDNVGPIITLKTPDISRGVKITNNSSTMHIAGVAKDISGIFSVVVNGTQASVDVEGNFSVDIAMDFGNNPFMIVATDQNYNKTTLRFESSRAGNSSVAANLKNIPGKYYALLIGVQDYQDPAIQKLDGPIGDIDKLTDVLEKYYTFDPANVTKLKNPTRSQFFEALDILTEKVTVNDNVIIFYAGHGNWDENRKQGYWYPADAKLNKRDSWITNADLIEYISSMKSKHTLLISDACFAGSIFKTRSIENATRDIKEMYNLPSRKAMTSGAMKQVPDKSVFIEYLVKRLAENTDEFLSAEQLFSRFKAAVINNSSNGQVPQFGEIRESGDEGGNFIFVKKK